MQGVQDICGMELLMAMIDRNTYMSMPMFLFVIVLNNSLHQKDQFYIFWLDSLIYRIYIDWMISAL